MPTIAYKQNSSEQRVCVDQEPRPLVSFAEPMPEEFMREVLRSGKRLILIEEIVLVEPFATSADGTLQSDRDFKSRIVLLDKDTVLCEEPPEEFVSNYGFRLIAADRVALNPAIRFAVEAFEPTEGFQPLRAYRTRLLWKGPNGAAHSKLILAPPERVLAIVSRREPAVRSSMSSRPSIARTLRDDPA
jgi:hypothetical protein